MNIGSLHVITAEGPIAEVAQTVSEALEAGAPVIQLRRKLGTEKERLELGLILREKCSEARATFIVNDDADLAIELAADGVHIGSDDGEISQARSKMGPHRIIGATCRNRDEALQAERDGASYLGVGPVFATSTKHGLPVEIGIAGLSEIVAATSLPVIAIAGITTQRVGEVMRAGAHGVAVIGAIFESGDVAAATETFLSEIERGTIKKTAQ